VLGASRPVVFNGVGTFNTPAGTTVTVNNNASGASGPTKNGAGTLILGGANTFAGFVSANAGILSISNDNNLGTATSVSFNGGAILTTAGINSTKLLNVNGAGGSLDMGPFASTFGGITSNTTTATLHKTGTGVLTVNFARVGSLSIDNGTVAISSGRDALNKSSKLNGLSLAAGSALDLNANDLVFDYSNGGTPDPAQLNAVKGIIMTGYASGAWTGTGITSTAARNVAADGSNVHKTGLGYAEASAAGYTSGTFDGFTVDGDMVLVRYTFNGDCNLDGMVNDLDFTALATSFNQAGSWVNGDYNFDGVVNSLDYNSIATNFGLSLPSEPALAPALGSLVPEPSILTIGLLATTPMLRRRRR
jgi:autotransporter-associated beta strand protein